MAVGFNKKKRGIFGVYGDKAQQASPSPEMGAPGMGMARPEERSGPDWKGIGRNVLGNVGDAIAQHYGVQPVYNPMMQQQQAMQQRAALLAQQQRMQAMQAAQEREWGREDYLWEQANARDAFDRSVLRGGLDPDSPEGQALYRERAERTARGQDPILQGAPVPGGGAYYGPMSGYSGAVGSTQGGGEPTRPVGRLTPLEPNMQNTPAPELGANGMPSAVTRAQYQAIVNEMGEAETEAWARRNNIRVIN